MVLLLKETRRVPEYFLTIRQVTYFNLIFQNFRKSPAFSEQTFCPKCPTCVDQTKFPSLKIRKQNHPNFNTKQDEMSLTWGTKKMLGELCLIEQQRRLQGGSVGAGPWRWAGLCQEEQGGGLLWAEGMTDEGQLEGDTGILNNWTRAQGSENWEIMSGRRWGQDHRRHWSE